MVKAKHTHLGRTMRLWLTTLMSTVLLSACASSKYQNISHNEVRKYYGVYDGLDNFNSELQVVFNVVAIDHDKKGIKIDGKVVDAHSKEPIVNAGVAIIEFKKYLHDSITKEYVATDKQGYFTIESSPVDPNDRLNVGMIGYYAIYYRIGELVHSESP